ncbi:MAG: superoxide dismutase family protein [Oscillospiraceae bacterium]|nr:superoxide dismutase family protein [Oscillospiraceae bacterium]
MNRKLFAAAQIHGSDEYPNINGLVKFQQTPQGVLVTADICGLPKIESCYGVFAFHIHGGSCCTGNETDPFADAGTHYDPCDAPHPYHAGDLPPLFANNGRAYMSVLTSRFTVDEIIGKTVIIHSRPDDFTTQPSGNAGEKIACGVVCTNSRFN